MTGRHLVFGFCVLAMMAAVTVGVVAHLSVVKTMPADKSTVSEPPARVQVWFSQQPSPRVSRLDMKGPGGVVALGDLAVDRDTKSIAGAVADSLAPGSYTVTWRTAGDDGHVMRGTFTFTVNPAK